MLQTEVEQAVPDDGASRRRHWLQGVLGTLTFLAVILWAATRPLGAPDPHQDLGGVPKPTT